MNPNALNVKRCRNTLPTFLFGKLRENIILGPSTRLKSNQICLQAALVVQATCTALCKGPLLLAHHSGCFELHLDDLPPGNLKGLLSSDACKKVYIYNEDFTNNS